MIIKEWPLSFLIWFFELYQPTTVGNPRGNQFFGYVQDYGKISVEQVYQGLRASVIEKATGESRK